MSSKERCIYNYIPKDLAELVEAGQDSQPGEDSLEVLDLCGHTLVWIAVAMSLDKGTRGGCVGLSLVWDYRVVVVSEAEWRLLDVVQVQVGG